MKFKIKVNPNSPEDKVEQKSASLLDIDVKDKPEKNKANIKVLKLISKYLKQPVSNIKLKGLKSKIKFVEIK
jgi:uncharacterized protein YggU (UPF0235/DUF167 family)